MAAAAPAAAPAAAAAPAPAKPQEKTADAKSPSAAAEPATKSARVFVGNVAFKTTADELKEHMMKASPNVLSAEIISYSSGRSKGCGLVEFKTSADAEKAVKELTNTDLGGRKIFVREDREPAGFGKNKEGKDAAKDKLDTSAPPAASSESGGRGGRGGRGRGRGRGRGGRGGGGGRGGFGGASSTDPPSRASNSDVSNLYVGNLAWATTDADLKQLFTDFGEVTKCVIATDRSGRSKGFATVTMAKASDAQAAISTLNDTEFHDRKIVVRMDQYSS